MIHANASKILKNYTGVSPTRKEMSMAEKDKDGSSRMAIFISLGLSFGAGPGVAFGVVFDKVGMGIAVGAGIGMLFGIVFGVAFSSNK